MVGSPDNKIEENKDSIYVTAQGSWPRISKMEIHQL